MYIVDRRLIHYLLHWNINSFPLIFLLILTEYLDVSLTNSKNFGYNQDFCYWTTDTIWSQSVCLHMYTYIQNIYVPQCISRQRQHKRFDSNFRHKHPLGPRSSNKLFESFDPVQSFEKDRGAKYGYRHSQFQRQAQSFGKINPSVNASVRFFSILITAR